MVPLAGEGEVSLKTLRHRAWRYGLTVEALVAMYRQQNGVCAICGVDRPLVVDHDHRCCPPGRWGDNPSGRVSCGRCVRSLICFDCNTILGRVNDRDEVLEQAVVYLRFHRSRMPALQGGPAQATAVQPGSPDPPTSGSRGSRARASLRPRLRSRGLR